MVQAARQEWQLTREDCARWGAIKALYALLMRLLRRTLGIRIAYVISRPLHDDLKEPEAPAGYRVRLFTDADYATAIAIPAFNASPEFVAQARAEGGFCLGAFKDDALVASVWRAFGDAPAEQGYRLHVRAPLRYGYKARTLPDHRGLHLQSAISFLSDRHCIERGATTGASYIETHNYPSLRGDFRRGGQTVGWIAWLSRGRLRWCYTSPGSRRFGLELYDPEKASG